MTTVFVVMQPQSGMVLAKSFYRFCGTMVGLVVMMVFISLFSQQPVLFLSATALWVGICTAGAARNRNFRSYGFVLAGYTAALIGIPAAQHPEAAYLSALTRVGEVTLGIVCSGAVSALIFPQHAGEQVKTTVRRRFTQFVDYVCRALSGNMERAQAKQQQDEVLLSKTTIVAPFGGIVGLRQVSPGAYLRAGDDIVRLENVSSVKLDFRVPEAYLSKLKPNQEVSVKTDAFPNDTFKGRIFALEPGVDEKTRTVLARALIPNAQNKLRAGMFARVNVLLETRPNSILVPEQAIWPQGRDTFVYRVVDGKAMLTKIELGVRHPGEVEVLKGLSRTDMVVTDGQMKLKDGAPVIVMPAPPPASPPAPGKAASAHSTIPARA